MTSDPSLRLWFARVFFRVFATETLVNYLQGNKIKHFKVYKWSVTTDSFFVVSDNKTCSALLLGLKTKYA
jgi:hypothetical protein